jgi:Reverse transcriptase (RNA-dependent DNA polymerase)
VIDINSKPQDYRFARVPKGGGDFRIICIPNTAYAESLKARLPQLEAILAQADSTRSNYAFERGKNCALMALHHVGYRYTLSLDLKDFFDSVRPEHVARIIPEDVISLCFVDGSPKQGLPTSPLIATIAFLECDARISGTLQALKLEVTYTRYADDLVFSFNNRRDAGKIKLFVDQLVQKHGFRLNKRKTRLQDATNGRVIITGIAVDSEGIHATRQTKRKMRAALHQRNSSSMSGLTEWSKCKLPLKLLVESNTHIPPPSEA